MPASLDMLETAVQAAVQAMIDCKTIPSESVNVIWSDSGHKELEPMLRGSLLKFEAVGAADAFFAAVPTSGEVVFGVGDRAKLGFHKSGGTGAMTKMTGTELVAAGLTDCILGIFTNGAGSGANADSVMVGGLATTLAPVCSSEFARVAITINEGQQEQEGEQEQEQEGSRSRSRRESRSRSRSRRRGRSRRGSSSRSRRGSRSR